MQGDALVKRGSQGAVQAVLEVEFAGPEDHMRKQITVERRVFRQQCVEIENSFRRYQLVQADLSWWDTGPFALAQPVLRIGTSIADRLEDHSGSLVSYDRSFLPLRGVGGATDHLCISLRERSCELAGVPAAAAERNSLKWMQTRVARVGVVRTRPAPLHERRMRDLNPRGVAPNTLSRRAP